MMFYLDQSTGKRYYPGKPFTYGELQYSQAGATAETFTNFGFVQITPQPRPDDRFYFVQPMADDGSYAKTPRDLNELKLFYIMLQKKEARFLLSESDWYVIRAMESDADVPDNFRDYRISVRAASDSRCAEIFAAETVEALETLIKATDALTAWPTPLTLQETVAQSYGLGEDGDASSGY